MIDGYTAGNVGQDRMTLIVNGEKEIAAGREADSSNVFAMGKGQSVGFVAVVSKSAIQFNDTREDIALAQCAGMTYFTRSKIVTRFPTGEKRWVPSGLNTKLPWQ